MLFWTRIYLQKWYRLFVFICICDIPLCRVPLPDHKCPLVVLFLQAARVHWHLFLHTAEKQSPNHISPRLPPRQHAEHLVVRHELDTLRSLWVFYSDSHSNASRTLCFVLFCFLPFGPLIELNNSRVPTLKSRLKTVSSPCKVQRVH